MEVLLIAAVILVFALVSVGVIRLSERWSKPEDIQDLGPVYTEKELYEADKEYYDSVVDALGINEDVPAKDEHGENLGYRVRSTTATSRVVVVPIMSKPYKKKSTGQLMPFMCPTCRIAHPVKSVHLWLDDTGSVIVSKGVLEELKSAGLENYDLVAEGAVTKPPPLQAGHGTTRAEIDQQNRKIVQYKVV